MNISGDTCGSKFLYARVQKNIHVITNQIKSSQIIDHKIFKLLLFFLIVITNTNNHLFAQTCNAPLEGSISLSAVNSTCPATGSVRLKKRD